MLGNNARLAVICRSRNRSLISLSLSIQNKLKRNCKFRHYIHPDTDEKEKRSVPADGFVVVFDIVHIQSPVHFYAKIRHFTDPGKPKTKKVMSEVS